MIPTFYVRRMTEADLMPVFGILNMNLDDFFSEDVVLFFLQQWPEGQLVATDFRGTVVGALCGARLDGGRASVSLLAVDAPYRHQGVGSLLLSALDRACIMSGISTVQLEVRTTNAAAIRFYRNKGFAITEELPSFYNDGGSGYRMVRRAGQISLS